MKMMETCEITTPTCRWSLVNHQYNAFRDSSINQANLSPISSIFKLLWLGQQI
jgi:hypothetical protein